MFFGILSCSKQGKESEKDVVDAAQQPVARVYESYLYTSDIAPIAQQSTSKADSAQKVQLFIQSWINQQLMIAEAESRLTLDRSEIDQKLRQYKYDLLVHELHKQHLLETVKEEVKEEEIVAYYTENKKNFELKNTIAKVHFLKIPLSSPRLARVEKLFADTDERARKELLTYCSRYADAYSFDDSIWVDFEELITPTAFQSIKNPVSYLKSTKIDKATDDSFIYFLRILEYRITDENAPLEFVKEQIRKILLNKRKLTAIKELEERIYNRAKESNAIQLY
jgi:hypothetical protein